MKRTLLGVAMGAAILGSVLGTNMATASDHDDGISDLKQTNTNLTDLYVFRKGEESVNSGDAGDPNTLVFVMNLNPRSVARTEYTFNTNARYEFNVSRFTGNPANDAPSSTISKDATLRVEFLNPKMGSNQQEMIVTYIADDKETSLNSTIATAPIVTTPLLAKGSGVTGTVVNKLEIDGQAVNLFAGLRQDTFFFDVQSFFALRTDIANGDGTITNFFKDDNNAVDFTRNFNVLSIVAEIPRALLQGAGTATTFDVWETISIKQ